MIRVEANGAFGGFLAGTAVVHAGETAFSGLVAAMNAKACAGGYDFPAFGTFF